MAAASGSLWNEARPGVVLAWVSEHGRVPDAPNGWRVVRVACANRHQLASPLLEARRAIEQLLGWQVSKRPPAHPHARRALRRRLMGHEGWETPAAALAAALANLARTLPDERVALVLDGLDHADPDTFGLIGRLATRPSGWPSAVLVGVREAEMEGSVARLIDALARQGRAMKPAPSPSEPRPGPAPLPPTSRAVLRAAALIGDRFDLDLLSRLLDQPPTDLLRVLQHAHDAGVPIEDLGSGHFRLPPELCATLRGELLPSLAEAWRRRLVTLLGTPDAPHHASQARAAEQLDALGEGDGAVRAYLDALTAAASKGALGQAMRHARQALSLLDRLPDSPGRSRVRGETLMELSAVQWEAVGTRTPAGDGITLAHALETARSAIAALDAGERPARAARARAIAAGALYDIGDAPSLEDALELLTHATRDLQQANEPRAAAGLLNDQAAVWVRIGDHPRAAHLLHQSRTLFSALANPSPTDRAELAETLLLISRLPLHVPARAGKTSEALRQAIDHANDAGVIYRDLSHDREAARADETRGRLLAHLGETALAAELLQQTYQDQLSHGDGVGLARTADALSELLASAGQPDRALQLLATSIELNQRTGSPRGLAYNRAALGALLRTLGTPTPQTRAVAEKLAQAEAWIGIGFGGPSASA